MLNKIYIKCINFIENDIILIIINYLVCADTLCSKYGKFQLTDHDLQVLPSFEKKLYNLGFFEIMVIISLIIIFFMFRHLRKKQNYLQLK